MVDDGNYSNEAFVCERVCTSDRLLKRLGVSAKVSAVGRARARAHAKQIFPGPAAAACAGGGEGEERERPVDARVLVDTIADARRAVLTSASSPRAIDPLVDPPAECHARHLRDRVRDEPGEQLHRRLPEVRVHDPARRTPRRTAPSTPAPAPPAARSASVRLRRLHPWRRAHDARARRVARVADARRRPVRSCGPQVPAWNDQCVRRCTKECMRLSSPKK